MASAWGKAFGFAFGAAWGSIADAVIQPPISRRRSGLGSLKIVPRHLPTDLTDLEELFEIDQQKINKVIRARSKRDEFLILH